MSQLSHGLRHAMRGIYNRIDPRRHLPDTQGLATLLVAWVLIAGFLPCAQAQVNDIFRITRGTFGSHVEYHGIDLTPGNEFVLADLNGPGKITYFYYTDDSNFHASDGSGRLYEGLVLKVYWDNAAEPSILVPLWAFFGAFNHKPI